MSLVAKVFVVLNLVVAVAFLIFAMNEWTAKTKWQKMYEKEKMGVVEIHARNQKQQISMAQRLVYEQQVNTQQKADLVRAKVEVNSFRDQLLEKQAELAQVKNKAEMADARNEELRNENKRYMDEIVKLQSVVRKQQQAVTVERENAVQARREKSEIETEYNSIKQQFTALTVDKRSIEDDLARQTARIEGLLARGVQVWDLLGEEPEASQPRIADGRVLAVRPEINLVMISVGSQQNVKPGFRFTISRGDQYVAKVQVEKVYPDMCSARVVPGLIKAGQEIQVHDEVKSGLR